MSVDVVYSAGQHDSTAINSPSLSLSLPLSPSLSLDLSLSLEISLSLDNVTHVGPPTAATAAATEFRRLIVARGDLRFKPAGGAVILPEPRLRTSWSEGDSERLSTYRDDTNAPERRQDVVLGVPVGDDNFNAAEK